MERQLISNSNGISNNRPLRSHLTKVERLPRCYKDVEKVICKVKSCQSNFKTVLANSRYRGAHFKKVYSLTVNVLKYCNYIQEIMNQIHLLEKEKFLKCEMASILIYEIIFGKGYIPGESKVVSIIQKYEKDIVNAHQMLQSSNPEKFVSTAINVPRYVRIHTLVTTVAYVIKDIENLGFHQVTYNRDITEAKFLELVRNIDPGSFLVDFHFKDMLVFEHSEKLFHLDIYKKGHIFLQDKASYIPIHALNPEPGSAVLDACAAPGMKTVHIASKMKNKGILIACERDKNRFESLKEMIQYGSVKIAKVLCKDFKSLDPMDQAYSTVEYILLDPSCSGSGMVSRMDEVTDTEDSKNKQRLLKLSGFQIILLKHALKFPSVKRVVYSTCSVHEEENENVVHEVLQQFKNQFKLVAVMPEWPERGLDHFEFGHLCLRTVPEKHIMNGFFVAMFERLENNDYEEGVRFSKNKKFKMNADALPDIKIDLSLKEPKWKNNNSVEKASHYLDAGFGANNDAEEIFLNNKECKLLQKQTEGQKNDSSSQIDSFESNVTKLNETIETNDTHLKNLGNEEEIKDIKHNSNINRKHKKKRKENDCSEIFSHSNKKLTSILIDETSILSDRDTSNGNQEKVNDFDHDSNIKHKKKKKSRKSSTEDCSYSVELASKINSLSTEGTVNENLVKEQETKDIELESKIKKKHKKKRTKSESDEMLCNVHEESINSVLSNKANSDEKLRKEPAVGFDQDPSILTARDISKGNLEELNDYDLDSNIKVKHKKKKKSRQSSIENECYPNELTTEDTVNENIVKEQETNDIELESKIKKKHKKKRTRSESDEMFCHGHEEFTNSEVANKANSDEKSKEESATGFDQDTNSYRKHKKKKRRKDSTEVLCPPTLNDEFKICTGKDTTTVNFENKMLTIEANSSLNSGKGAVTENSACDSNFSKKHKKKRKRKYSDDFFCKPNEESTNVLTANENKILTGKNAFNENSEEKPNECSDCDLKITKKCKKKKRKKESSEICQPSADQNIELLNTGTHTLTVKEKDEKRTKCEEINNEDVSAYKLKKKEKTF